MRRSLSKTTGLVVLLCGVVVTVQAFVLWSATGRAGLTRYYDPARAEREPPGGNLRDLFADTGVEDVAGPLPEVPNRFMLGLVPSGGGKHLVSLFTLVAPMAFSVLVVAIDALLARRRSRSITPAANANASDRHRG